MSPGKHIHLIGICGTAMASLAGMLKQRGFHVTGSDAGAYPPMSDFLGSLGIPVSQLFTEKNLTPRPDLVVVGNAISRGNAEFDHADIYKDLEAVETAFKRLVNLVPRRGRIVAFDEGDSVERSISRALCPVERYGATQNSTWRMTNLRLEPARTSWSVLHNGEHWADFEFSLGGEYNVLNATAAAALAAGCSISKDKIITALKTFKSVKRRLEVRAEVNGITIIDDFAHHPTAIAGTLTALPSRYPGARIWSILEPRSNTLRRNVLQNDLAKSLAMADEVVVANVFKSDAIPEAERLDLGSLAAQIQGHGRRARIVPEVDGIVQLIAPEMRRGDVVAILSNGGFGGIYEKLPQRLRTLAGPATNPAGARAKAKA